MNILRSVTGAAAAAAMLAGTAVPAAAQGVPPGYGWGNGWNGNNWDRGYRRHRDRGVSAGDVIAGVAVIGVIAAIAAAASSNNRNRDRNRVDDRFGGINSENEAADACAVRAEQRYGNGARASIDDVYRTRDGYDVRGSVESRARWNDDQRFSCSVRYGQIEGVRFGGDQSTWRGY